MKKFDHFWLKHTIKQLKLSMQTEKHMLSLQRLCLSMKHSTLHRLNQSIKLVKCQQILLRILTKIIMLYLLMKSKRDLKQRIIKMKKSRVFTLLFY